MRVRLFLIVSLLLFGPAAGADCPPGDFNNDCRVDIADLFVLADWWLMPSGDFADLDGNGYVDGVDLALFGKQWRAWECPIVINEILAHAHAAAPDWIEFHNVSSVPVDIGGWFLSDVKNDLQRYEIAAGTVVGPYGYVVLYETIHFASPFDPGVRRPFAFSENGEAAYLYSGNDEVFPDCLIFEQFGASDTGHTFGRYRTSTGTYDFVTMREATPGGANSYPLVGPVVINEIMYHPPVHADAEYIELLNISGGQVTLFDFDALEPWRVMDDSGTDFLFPSDVPVTLEANEHLLLVRDMTAVRGQYAVPAEVQVFEWGSGRLANQGEKVQLLRPGDVDEQGRRYWIQVDCVNYSDGWHGDRFADGVDPWPKEADGLGPSLNRLFPSRYGNDPNNWHATIPSPGSVND